MQAEKRFVESVSTSITKNALETGLDSLRENVVHSRALVPITPSQPRPKLIFVGSIISFVFAGVLLVLLAQLKYQLIFSLSQLIAMGFLNKKMFIQRSAFNDINFNEDIGIHTQELLSGKGKMFQLLK